MSDPENIQRFADEYADGHLSEESAQELVKLLSESDEARRQFAIVAAMERLLRALGKGGVPTDRIMARVRQESEALSRERVKPAGRRARPRIAVRAGKGRGAGVGLTREREADAASSRMRLSVAAVAVVAAIVGGVIWHRHKAGAVSPVPAEGGKGGDRTIEKPPPVPVAHDESGKQAPVAAVPTERETVKHPLERFFPLEPPPPAAGEDLSPPRGNGEDEPGFVPPPEAWIAAARAVEERGVSESSSGMGPRPPVLCVKVRHGELREWGVTPRDVSGLLGAMGETLGIRYGVETRTLDEVDADPTGNPILFLTGHYHFVLSRQQRCLLRRFILGGGTMVFNAGLGSKPFYDSARRELRSILPELPLERLGRDHPLYHAYHDLDQVAYCGGVREAGYNESLPWLEGVTLSCRTAAIVSRWGMAAGWEGKQAESFRAYRSRDAVRMGMNILTYGVSVRAWAKRTAHLAAFVERETPGADAMFVAQVVHGGEWRTRYAGLTMLLHAFNRRTEVPVKLGVRPMPLTAPGLFDVPLLYVTGHESLSLGAAERDALKRYLTNGGFLFAEACCGRAGFDRDFRALMKAVFTSTPLTAIPADAPIFRVPNEIELLGVTPALGARCRSMLIPPRLEGIKLGGNYVVIYSPYGLAGGWEMSQTPFADGYEDPDAIKLGQNILMYAITQ